MFGFKRKDPVRLVPFAEAMPQTFCGLLCDGVTAHGLGSFAALLDLHARLQAERPDVRILASLDDLGQACYTCGHAIDAFELDAGMPEADGDAAELEPDASDLGERFPIRLANLRHLAKTVTLDDVADIDWGSPDDGDDLVSINRDPESELRIGLEKRVIFQFVPAAAAADALAAFPNGYFKYDLNPAQTHVLAHYLESTYGLALFGIGARFLGFRRQGGLSDETARALVANLAEIYADSDQAAEQALTGLLTGRDWLLLRYTDS